MKYKIGQIYFWNDKGESLFGKAIQYYNKREFPEHNNEWLPTHVGIISQIDSKGERVLIHEASDKGFISSWYEMWWLNAKIENGYVKIGETKQTLGDNIFETCEKYNNIGYGWLDIFGILLHTLLGWRVLGLTGKNKIICSEAVSRILYDLSKSIDFQKEYGVVYDAISPAHIFLSKFIRIL